MQNKYGPVTPTQRAIINRIIDLCQSNDLTISEMATRCGIPREGLRDIVSGKNKRTYVITIKIICDAFDMTLDEFFATEEFRNLEQAIK